MAANKEKLKRLLGEFFEIESQKEAARTFLLERLEKKLASHSDGDLVSPNPILAPVVGNLAHAVKEPLLCDMYVNLMATAMRKETAQDAHPSFLTIVQQLSADEAKILAFLSREHRAETAVIQLVSMKTDQTQEQFVLRHFSLLAEDAKCQFPEYVPMYMENFCRLGLAELEYHASLSDAALYQRILDAPYIVTLRKEIQEQQRMPKAIKGIFSLTTMGMLFNNACLEVGV